MRRILHILTRPEDSLARELIAKQQQSSEQPVEVIDFTTKTPDYAQAVERIFLADSVQIW